jgi:hypothetical protein
VLLLLHGFRPVVSGHSGKASGLTDSASMSENTVARKPVQLVHVMRTRPCVVQNS